VNWIQLFRMASVEGSSKRSNNPFGSLEARNFLTDSLSASEQGIVSMELVNVSKRLVLLEMHYVN
jgi:hypothetical protein